ncbi:MAG TPA: GlsB/YeaQ/YmgE family stress response membrane protein [Casimicrobiaceae bacterium]|nr:GlsB/YeaQ/YmgE family stress response membrane protein [Casimicrobiaceae bacterium]
MSIIWTIVIGFIVGLLAKLVMPGKDPGGFLITAALGIAGSLLASYGGRALGIYGGDQTAGFIGAFLGAIVLLIIYRLVMRNRNPSP